MRKLSKAILRILGLCAATFYMAPLALGMVLGWGDDLHFTPYDEVFFVSVTAFFAWSMIDSFRHLGDAL